MILEYYKNLYTNEFIQKCNGKYTHKKILK